MGKRTSPNAIKDANDLSQLGNIVQDKRNGKRAGAKKSRRNRHYEKQLIRNAISAGVLNGVDAEDVLPAGRADDA
jgi:hypothetical protein